MGILYIIRKFGGPKVKNNPVFFINQLTIPYPTNLGYNGGANFFYAEIWGKHVRGYLGFYFVLLCVCV